MSSDMSILDEIREHEENRRKFELNIAHEKHFRDFKIKKAFDAGARQKEIANVCGLGESTVKHIIAEIRGRKKFS